MQRRLIRTRIFDLSQDNPVGDTMISAKFIVICGMLMATIAMFISSYLVVGALSISAYNAVSKPSNSTYIVSVSMLLLIAARAAWIMQSSY